MEGFLPRSQKNCAYTRSVGGRYHSEVEKEKRGKKPKEIVNQQSDAYFDSVGHYKTKQEEAQQHLQMSASPE